ncbi:conserved exported hypothetical protein [Bacillus sp. 349Y]|nr:conserved exported hypothetical protein [Bacillus sp. 349Y]
MKKVMLLIISSIMLVTTLFLPTSALANEDENDEAIDIESGMPFDTPPIIKDTYLDENGSLVTEYEYFDEALYDEEGNILSGITEDGEQKYFENDSGFKIMNACAPTISSKLISDKLSKGNKKMGWHPDFPKGGNKNVSTFWFSNKTKNVSYSLGADYGGASIGVSVSIGNGSGHSIKNPTPQYWMRPAVISNVHKRVTEFKQPAKCGMPAKTWRKTAYVAKKTWYRADKVK